MSYNITTCDASQTRCRHEHFVNCPYSELKTLLLDNFGKNTVVSDSGRSIRIPKKDFQKGIDNISKMTFEAFAEKYPTITRQGYFKQNFLASMSVIRDEAAKDSEYVTLNQI